jgi:hypothetical protein
MRSPRRPGSPSDAWHHSGSCFGNPRGGTIGLVLSIRRVFPDRYPLTDVSVADLIAGQHRFFRDVDYGVIGARIDVLYAFAARSLGEPRVEALVSDGVPAYVWPSDAREPWLNGGKRVVPRLLARASGAQWAFNEQQL